jgi:hypothetical protein
MKCPRTAWHNLSEITPILSQGARFCLHSPLFSFLSLLPNPRPTLPLLGVVLRFRPRLLSLGFFGVLKDTPPPAPWHDPTLTCEGSTQGMLGGGPPQASQGMSLWMVGDGKWRSKKWTFLSLTRDGQGPVTSGHLHGARGHGPKWISSLWTLAQRAAGGISWAGVSCDFCPKLGKMVHISHSEVGAIVTLPSDTE